jgi:hypothetical protein
MAFLIPSEGHLFAREVAVSRVTEVAPALDLLAAERSSQGC